MKLREPESNWAHACRLRGLDWRDVAREHLESSIRNSSGADSTAFEKAAHAADVPPSTATGACAALASDASVAPIDSLRQVVAAQIV